MGNSEEGKSSKSEKSSSPSREQSNVHVYPDWAAMQAYYGPRVAVPPYFNSAIAAGHAPHPYMWGPPQPMMPPYGTPYAAIYAHGGVYAHPGVPLATTSMSMDTSAKSSGNTDRGLMNKLKGFDGLAMSIGNGNPDNGTDHGPSNSGETEGSSDGSDGNTVGAAENNKKRSREVTPSDYVEEKTQKRSHPVPASEVNGVSEKVIGVPPGNGERVVGTVASPNMKPGLELRNPASTNVKASPTNVPVSVLPSDAWPQNERELKRLRRKQSNRESARRSRLRKQAETEELAKRVQSLTAENLTLKSEINKLTENSEKLKLENARLMDKLKTEQLGHQDDASLTKIDDKRLQPVGTANLLARVNNTGSADRNSEEGERYDNNSSGAKLRQLLDASPRTDTVAAG